MPYPGFDHNNRFIGTREEELEYYAEFKKKYQFPHPVDYHKAELITYGDNLKPLAPYKGQKCYAID